MSQKYVIGLTGNIATGKSMVRRMLEELGTSTIDTDSLVHLLQRPNTPVYKKTVEVFGTFVLDQNGQLNRKRLGGIVFNIPEALQALEAITHPAVIQQIDRVIDKAPKPIVVIEAIKLFESGLADKCDAVWVVDSTKEAQVARLVSKRNLSQTEAVKRVETQPMQTEKLSKATKVIDNNGDLVQTWSLVQKLFGEISKGEEPETVAVEATDIDLGNLEIRRAKPSDSANVAEFISASSQGELILHEDDMMERLFSKGYLIAFKESEVVGTIGWQTENLISGIEDFFVKETGLWSSVGQVLLDRAEQAISELSCEASLLFIHNSVASAAKPFLESREYEEKDPQNPSKVSREVREASREWFAEGTTMMYRKLLERRIMTPI